MSLVVNPLHPLFAAEMLGADLREPPTPALVAAVNEAMAKYAVLVVRDQRIDDDQQIRFSRAFGPLELPPHMGMKPDAKRRIAPEMYDVSNLDVDGDFMPAKTHCAMPRTRPTRNSTRTAPSTVCRRSGRC